MSSSTKIARPRRHQRLRNIDLRSAVGAPLIAATGERHDGRSDRHQVSATPGQMTRSRSGERRDVAARLHNESIVVLPPVTK